MGFRDGSSYLKVSLQDCCTTPNALNLYRYKKSHETKILTTIIPEPSQKLALPNFEAANSAKQGFSWMLLGHNLNSWLFKETQAENRFCSDTTLWTHYILKVKIVKSTYPGCAWNVYLLCRLKAVESKCPNFYAISSQNQNINQPKCAPSSVPLYN